MNIQEALDALELRGHRVDRENPLVTRQGKTFYRVDEVMRSEEQIFAYIIDGTPLGT
jgi:hypothetical protein